MTTSIRLRHPAYWRELARSEPDDRLTRSYDDLADHAERCLRGGHRHAGDPIPTGSGTGAELPADRHPAAAGAEGD